PCSRRISSEGHRGRARINPRIKQTTDMRHRPASTALLYASLLLASQGWVIARDLTFEDRVKAQEAIERVYYSHQMGTTKPFEEAVPHDLLVRKVRTYLKQTVALEAI